MIELVSSIKVQLTVILGGIVLLVVATIYVLMYNQLSGALLVGADRYLVAEFQEFQSFVNLGGVPALQEEMNLEERTQGSSHIFIRVFDPMGNELARTDLSGWGTAAGAIGPFANVTLPTFRTVALEGSTTGEEVRRIEGFVSPDVYVIFGVASNTRSVLLKAFRERFFSVFIVALGVGMGAAWLLTRRSMRGIDALTVAADEIAAGALDKRIPEKGFGYEVDRLATVFNRMVQRIAALINEARTLNDNIAHELRSPLTRIRGVAEAAATDRKTVTRTEDLASVVVEECDDLLRLINSMLAISQMESGLVTITHLPVDCARLVRDTCEFFQPAAEDRGIALTSNVSSPVQVRGDNARLYQAIANLIDNAVKFTPSGGTVMVKLAQPKSHAEITISDTGPGIAPQDLPHIFDRFYRGTRTRNVPGNGLGLGLARAIVQAHGGDIEVSSELGVGTEFRVRIPQ